MAGIKAKGSKKGRKHGRNKKWCEAYARDGRREINKARNLFKAMKRNPKDSGIFHLLQNFSSVAKQRAGVPQDVTDYRKM